ncbi:transposable element Tc1 transposase [Trichonephila clavipes]|nr:transposable element Tc1 transposase [Trichonephila clavipes]
MLTGDVLRLATNPTSNCVLTIIKDVSGVPVQSADPAFPIARHTGPQLEVIFVLQYPGLIFQQNNARPHTARVAMNCLTACQTLPWTARLADRSPIKHVWDMIVRLLHLSGKGDDLIHNNWSPFIKKYRRRSSGWFITLYATS